MNLLFFGLVNHGWLRLRAFAGAGDVGPFKWRGSVQDVWKLSLGVQFSIEDINRNLAGLAHSITLAQFSTNEVYPLMRRMFFGLVNRGWSRLRAFAGAAIVPFRVTTTDSGACKKTDHSYKDFSSDAFTKRNHSGPSFSISLAQFSTNEVYP